MRFIKYFTSIRWFEIFVRCGAPFLGVILSVENLREISFLRLFLLIFSYFMLISHIYLYNELKGKGFDFLDSFKKTPLLKGDVSYFSLFIFSLIILFSSIIIYFFLNPFFLIFAFINLLMGILYVHPKILLKDKPIFSIIFLFIANFNDFLIGWLLFKKITFEGILISIYFGILGAKGQIIHEVKDFEADKISGIRTNAVRFGKKRLFFSGIIIYSISTLFFVFISLRYFKEPYFIPQLLSYPFYLYFFINVIKRGFDRAELHKFVFCYRIIYILIGATIFLIKTISICFT